MFNNYPSFLKKWEYHNPTKTREYFITLENDSSLSDIDKLQLQTQIARTFSLERQFDKAHEILDKLEPKINQAPVVHVRYLLERGRTFNSNNQKEKANEHFLKAWDAANKAKIDGLAVDAAHMVAIAYADPEKQLEWNLKALDLAQRSSDEHARQWLASLYNNIGWTYHDKNNFEKALELFQKGLELRIEQKAPEMTITIAKWTVARALRSLNRIDDALTIQEEIYQASKVSNNYDGYNLEELGELYLKKGDEPKAKDFFQHAYKELSKDSWFVENEKVRLERLKSFL